MVLLDEMHYSFSDESAQELLNRLRRMYSTNPEIRNLVQDAGIDDTIINFSGSADATWHDVLEKAASAGKLRALVQAVRDGPYGDGATEWLDPLLADAPTLPPGFDAYELALLPPRRSFIDRSELRGHLRLMSAPYGDRVLFVRGEHARGKSHTWHLISYLHASRNAPFTPYRLNLSSWAGPKYTPINVMDEVAARLGWEPIEVDKTAQPDTIVRLLVAKFITRAKASGDICLVFDGYTLQNSDNYARKLIMEIAGAAHMSDAGRLRVIVLEVDAPLPADLADDALQEDLGPGRLTDLRAFFQTAAKMAGEQVDESALVELLTAVLGPPPHPDEFELRDVGPKAARVASRAFARRA